MLSAEVMADPCIEQIAAGVAGVCGHLPGGLCRNPAIQVLAVTYGQYQFEKGGGWLLSSLLMHREVEHVKRHGVPLAR